MESSTTPGPWIVEPDEGNDGRLAVAFFRRWGFSHAALTGDLPEAGTVVLLSCAVPRWEQEARAWAAGSRARWLVLEPPPSAGPLPGSWSRLVLTQKRSIPARAPSGPEAIDDAYLTELVEVAWTGLETRLAYGKGLNAVVAGYIFIAARLLAERAERPQAVLARAEPFALFLARGTPAQQEFGRAAFGWMHGKPPPVIDYMMAGYLLDRLCRRPAARPRPPEDNPQAMLLYHAHRVAADNDHAAWDQMLAHLDLHRGLFRRSRQSPLGQWQLHPVVVCAVARRLGRYAPAPLAAAAYPEPPVGAGPRPGGCWLDRTGNVCRLRGSLLTDAARRMDPPLLDYPHTFGEWGDLSGPEHTLLEALTRSLPLGSRRPDTWPGGHRFCLCIRHDVDRPLTPADMDRHLRLEDALGCASSWYFKRETFDRALAGELRSCGREVGYHAEKLSTGDDGFAGELAHWLGGRPGLTYHGGLGSEFWKGRPSLELAVRFGARYAEMPVGRHTRPGWWCHDGGGLPVTPLPVKFDMYPDKVEDHAAWLVQHGGLVIVENHPDLCGRPYQEFLERLGRLNPVRLTVADALEVALPPSP